MRRYLVVANQTLGADMLNSALEERIERGGSQFYVVVPLTVPHDSSSDLKSLNINTLEGHMLGVWPGASEGGPTEPDKARSRAQRRLNLLIAKIQSSGGRAAGEVGDPNPAVAVKNVLRTQTFDEIIISTLPTGLSKWVKMDLSGRVSRMSAAPVTTLTAKK